MSDQSWLHPMPPQLGDLRDGTQDSRYYDFGPDLRLMSDPIKTLISVTVARVDGQPLGATDLTVALPTQPPPWVDATGYVVNWWEGTSGGIAALGSVPYIITVTFSTVGGRELTYDVYQDVAPLLG
jgi:hypothetical protein